MTQHESPPGQDEQPDLFGPSPMSRFSAGLQNYLANRRALTITAVLLLVFDALTHVPVLITDLPYLRYQYGYVHNLQPIVMAVIFGGLYGFSAFIVYGSPKRIPLALGIVAARGFHDCMIQANNLLIQWVRGLPLAAPESTPSRVLDFAVPIAGLLLPMLIVFILYKLLQATLPERIAPPVQAATTADSFPPPSGSPVLACQNPADQTLASQRRLAIILLWIIAGVRTCFYIYGLLTREPAAHAVGELVWKLLNTLAIVGPIVGAILPALWLRKPHAMGTLIILGLCIGFGSSYAVGSISDGVQVIANAVGSHVDLASLFYFLWEFLFLSIYVAAIWSLRRLLALQVRVAETADPPL